ncbi:hypothetical protein [Pelagicoccus sp. SDUM812002]|uniref:CAF17-like 4Fe-4S cluster assembly/insertion protein YgfZ n=1 Tax=Pelagicoccus sp. SDUM812002 TaxID=3041266 RepID=UPI00280CB383|nr:hypothetical protein [Pelagicoccus sp. SDUM812002]MDQ8188149.1 hypothetical protein [Pelagicoccus sp. SDUM812002]
MQIPRFFKYNAQASLGVSGPDALEFLQGQFSNDLSSIAVGQVVYGLWLDRKGKIVADSFVLRRGEESFTLLSYFCESSAILDRLDAYLVMEDAELAASSERAPAVAIWGEQAQSSACEALGLETPDRGGFAENGDVVAFWGRRGSESVLEVVNLREDESSRFVELVSQLSEMGAVELTLDEATALAIESKVPQIGRGFGDADLPQELSLEVDAVSFRKGCYLGQEVMARLHAMGRVRKGLKVMGIEGSTTISEKSLPLDLVDDAGKRFGQLRSVAYSKSGGIGLGVVSHGFVGQRLFAGEVEVTLYQEKDKSDG